MHFTEGELRSYLDGGPSGSGPARLAEHLESCRECRSELEALRTRADRVRSSLSVLAPEPSDGPIASSKAYAAFAARAGRNPASTARHNRRDGYAPRPIWAALGVLVFALGLLLVPSVRAAASNFLGLFRVEQVAVIEVNPINMPDRLGSSTAFEQLLADDVEVVHGGEPVAAASAAEASAASGIPVRLPTQANGPPQLLIRPGSRVTYQVDLERLQLLLTELDPAAADLPEQLDGALVTLDVPTAVFAGYGDCDLAGTHADARRSPAARMRDCTVLIQIPSPTITAPPGLDLERIGTAFLQLMGMSPAEAARFSETVDWATTLVIPIPRNGARYSQVSVDGVTGTLLQQELEDHRPQFVLIWVKDGIVYALSGEGYGNDFRALADSLE